MLFRSIKCIQIMLHTVSLLQQLKRIEHVLITRSKKGNESMYKYETHLHTKEGSACAGSTGAQMALEHKRQGYDGIFITDHFFNGNTAVPKNLPWKERVNLFVAGYESAKQQGDQIGLDVFFGFEYAINNLKKKKFKMKII